MEKVMFEMVFFGEGLSKVEIYKRKWQEVILYNRSKFIFTMLYGIMFNVGYFVGVRCEKMRK